MTPTPERRHLAVAPPDVEGEVPAATRLRVSRLLSKLAVAADSPTGVTVDSVVDYEPWSGAIVVMFTAEGEPAPFVVGPPGVDWPDAMRSANDAVIHLTGNAPFAERGLAKRAADRLGHDPTSRYELVRESWLGDEQRREMYRLREAAKVEREAREKPWLCGCRRRFATERGLAMHRTRSRCAS